jgi:hypothetical protein
MPQLIPGKVVATILLVVLGAPLMCLALPAGIPSGTTAGGCHGHHGRLPLPIHSCCYAGPQAPAQIQIASLLAPVNVVVADVKLTTPEGFQFALAAPLRAAFSPSPPSVLRI